MGKSEQWAIGFSYSNARLENNSSGHERNRDRIVKRVDFLLECFRQSDVIMVFFVSFSGTQVPGSESREGEQVPIKRADNLCSYLCL